MTTILDRPLMLRPPAPTGETLVEVSITCLACAHASPVQVPRSHVLDPLAQGIFCCEECGARMAYGKLLYREVVEPFVDARGIAWLRRRFQDPKTRADVLVVDVDPQFAASGARDVLSLVIP